MANAGDFDAVSIYYDIDALSDPMYGEAAYRHVFTTVGADRIREVGFFSGDTEETLNGQANEYIVSVVSNPDVIASIVARLEVAAPIVRLVKGVEVVQREPLCFEGSINSVGEVVDADDGSWLWWMYPEQARERFGSLG